MFWVICRSSSSFCSLKNLYESKGLNEVIKEYKKRKSTEIELLVIRLEFTIRIFWRQRWRRRTSVYYIFFYGKKWILVLILGNWKKSLTHRTYWWSNLCKVFRIQSIKEDKMKGKVSSLLHLCCLSRWIFFLNQRTTTPPRRRPFRGNSISSCAIVQ